METITITDTKTKLTADEPTVLSFDKARSYIHIRNDGTDTAYAVLGAVGELSDTADGVMSVPSGGSTRLDAELPPLPPVICTVKGSITVMLSNADSCPFKTASGGGDTDITVTGNPVKLDGLQSGVPYSGIVISGDDITGHEITLEISRENLCEDITKLGFAPTVAILKEGEGYCAYAKCTPNTTYTIHRKGGNCLNAAWTKEKPKHNLGIFGKTKYDDNAETACYTTGSEAAYVVFAVSNVNSYTTESGVNDVRIELGDTTAEEPYSTTVTPDSTTYSVAENIMQFGGVHFAKASEGVLSVTGVRKNAAVGKIWSEMLKLIK